MSVQKGTDAMEATDQLLLSLILVSAVTDVYVGRVFDWVTWPCMVLGVALNALLPGGRGAASSVGGLLLGFGVLYIVFLSGKMGGGDVKLMGAIGALKGLAFVYAVLVYSFLVGGLFSILVLIWTPSGTSPPPGDGPPSRRPSPAIPFGAAICLAALWALAEEFLGQAVVDWLL